MKETAVGMRHIQYPVFSILYSVSCMLKTMIIQKVILRVMFMNLCFQDTQNIGQQGLSIRKGEIDADA